MKSSPTAKSTPGSKVGGVRTKGAPERRWGGAGFVGGNSRLKAKTIAQPNSKSRRKI